MQASDVLGSCPVFSRTGERSPLSTGSDFRMRRV
jgi:hypothetical protein